ncbi:MAG: hypothetical protein WD065_13750 [Planctomycetaceae bacterium]
MIAGYHVIFSAYGFWLPNDPRGSWSDFIGSWDLIRYGAATKTNERKSLAYRDHDRSKRVAAKESLNRPAVLFNGIQARTVAVSIGEYFCTIETPIWACAVLPDHIHLVIGRPPFEVETVVIQLKGNATKKLLNVGIHPFQSEVDEKGRRPKCFSRGEWKVFLDPPDVPRAIDYVERNPENEGKRRQRWSFVAPYVV